MLSITTSLNCRTGRSIFSTVYNRIMNYKSNNDNNRVIQSEADVYENL
jgi:hypothetical protein